MISKRHFGNLVRISVLTALLVSPLALFALPGVSGYTTPSSATTGPHTLPGFTLVASPPGNNTQPDDISRLAVHDVDHDRGMIWTEFQNGIQPNGTAGSTGGPTKSAVVAFDPITGQVMEEVKVLGHVDGLTADHITGTIITTSNEDNNSFMSIIDPITLAVTTYRYVPDPAVNDTGGTDSIALVNGEIFVSHSNPLNTRQATTYKVTLNGVTHIAKLSPVFWDDSRALDVNTGKIVTMALTDPDTNYQMPLTSPRFGGDLATISQADGKIVFDVHVNDRPKLYVLSLTDNVKGNVPPIDGLAVATTDNGTLYVVDAGAGTITALSTNGWAAGTVFVSEPDDNGNPILGVLNLTTGHITPLGNSFISPKGILFVPSGSV